MNNIDTSFVVDPSIQQPFTVKSLDFLQDKDKVFADSIAKALAPYSFDNGDPIILAGCERTTGSPNTYFAGFIYWNNEIFAFDGGNVTITTTDSFKIVVTNDPTADPLTFTDGISRNVHNIRKMVVVDTSAGGTAFLYSAAKFHAKWRKTNTATGVGTSTAETSLVSITPSQRGSNVVLNFLVAGQITGTGTSGYRIKKNGSTVKTITVTNSNAYVSTPLLWFDTAVTDSDVFLLTHQGSTGSGTVDVWVVAENF